MTHYIQKEKFDITQLDGEWIILNANDFTVTKLNEMGGYCWSLLKEKQSVASIVQSIKEDCDNEHSVESSDIEHFLKELIECGLVVHEV
jgi:hypothetical protein